LNFEHDLDNMNAYQLAKKLGQKSFSSKVIVRTHSYGKTDTGLIALPGPLKW